MESSTDSIPKKPVKIIKAPVQPMRVSVAKSKQKISQDTTDTANFNTFGEGKSPPKLTPPSSPDKVYENERRRTTLKNEL